MPDYTPDPKNTGDTFTAAEWTEATNEIEEQEQHDVEQDALITGIKDTNTGDARPISAWYRPLRGATTDIGVSVLTGETPATTNYAYTTTGKWRVCAGTIAALASDATQGVNTCAGLGNSSSIQLNAFSIEFWSDATDLRFVFNNVSHRDFWVTVDDQLVAEYLLAANVADGLCTVYLTQPTAILRKWRIGIPIAGWKGVSTNSGAKVVPTSESFNLALVAASLGQGNKVIANALGAGVSATLSATYLAGQLEQITGIDVWRMCHDGSGYLAQGAIANSTGPFGSTARMAALAALTGLDAIVIFTAGGNDLSVGGATVSSIVTAAQTNWSATAAAQPGVPIIVMGCYRETNTLVGTTRDDLNTALRTAALIHPNVTDFIDIFNDPPYTGTGYDGSPTGSGAADVMVSTDQTHPTFPGAKQFGQHVARKLGRIMIPVKAGT